MDERLNDREITQRLREGDAAAWEMLCQRYGTRLWKYVARLVGADEQAVADVFQETMLAVAGAGRRLDPQAKLWAWLARIAHNQAALHWRRVFRDRPPAGDRSREADRQAASGDPLEAVSRRETAGQVRRLLAEMPADYVTHLTAKYVDELSIAEMVELLGGTAESVRSKLARARREFRRRYEGLERIERREPARREPAQREPAQPEPAPGSEENACGSEHNPVRSGKESSSE